MTCKRSIIRKIIALLLGVIIFLAGFPNQQNVVKANASSLSEDDIRGRINYIASVFSGNKVFGVNCNSGCGTGGGHLSCDNCKNSNVITAGWFKNAFGDVQVSQFPTHYTLYGEITQVGWTCAGFANFAEWYIFRSSNADTVTTFKVGNVSYDYNSMRDTLRIGDVLRLDDEHSAIAVDVTSQGVMVLDCNWTNRGSLPNSVVQTHVIPYSYYSTAAVSRVDMGVTPGKGPDVADFHVGEIKQSNGTGFTVMAKVTAASGIKSVRYAVWTIKNDQDDIIWYDGVCTDNNDYYWARVPFSSHKNEKGIYRIHIYAYDNNNRLTNLGIDINFDSSGPTSSDFNVGEFREGAFTILGKVKAVNGVRSVKYAVWTEKNGQDDIKWYNGNPNLPGDNLYWARVNFADHKGEKGKYIIHMYAYDNADQKLNIGIQYTFPETGPSISNINVSNISSSGYTVTCNVSNTNSDAGVARVQFPTWTDKNGQDDIASDWGKNSKVSGTISNGKATFVVKASDHNNETGTYHTHIYAYDKFGNVTSVEIPDVNVHTHVTEIIKGTLATCTQDGLSDGKKCSICNEIIEQQKVIKASGHIEETIPAVAATCTASGTTAGKKCSKCGEILFKPTVVPAKGHTVVIDKGTPATKTSIGLTDGSHCSVCNAIITRQQIIPALGGNDDQKPDNPNKPTNPTNPTTTTPSVDNGEKKPGTDNGVGTISADGRILTDTNNVKYYVSEKLKSKDLKKNLIIADKKSGGKYKITKVIKKKGKVVGGNVTYMAPYNKNCTKATAGATVKLGGVSFKITALNANAFKDCKKLTTFKAGGNMLTIGKNAFNGCSSLKSVTITSTKLKSIGSNAFKGTTSKTKYKVPKSRVTKYTIMILKAGASVNSKITK